MFAYPDAPADLMARGALDPVKCCIACSRCTELMRMGSTAGCAVRDHPLYSSLHRDATNAARIRHDRRPPDRGRVSMPVYSVNTLVVGSGAAALGAAVWLGDFGQRDGRHRHRELGRRHVRPRGPPTSRPTTKLSLDGPGADCARLLARICSPAGSMHGTLPCVKPNTRPRRSTASSSWACRFPAIGSAGSRAIGPITDERGRATSAGPGPRSRWSTRFRGEVVARGDRCFSRGRSCRC